MTLYYPKIPDTKGCPGGRCIAFDKIDGTNTHWDWERDYGFHAFGTRRDCFNLDDVGNAAFLHAHPGLEGTYEAFHEIAEPLARVLHALPANEYRVFAELIGEGSFAGEHVAGSKRQLVIFDVEETGKGMMPPETFTATLGGLPTPRVIYMGKFTGQLVEDIREGRLHVAEGAVIKGTTKPWVAKVKTNAYMARLKAAYGTRWTDHWE